MGAVSVEDVLARRIGLQLFNWCEARSAAPAVGRCLANELGWSETHMKEGVNEYTSKIDRLLEAAGLSEHDSELKISWNYGFTEGKKS